jgi:hypothetical protein
MTWGISSYIHILGDGYVHDGMTVNMGTDTSMLYIRLDIPFILKGIHPVTCCLKPDT